MIDIIETKQMRPCNDLRVPTPTTKSPRILEIQKKLSFSTRRIAILLIHPIQTTHTTDTAKVDTMSSTTDDFKTIYSILANIQEKRKNEEKIKREDAARRGRERATRDAIRRIREEVQKETSRLEGVRLHT